MALFPKAEQTYSPAIPFLGVYPGETLALKHKGTCTRIFIAAISVQKLGGWGDGKSKHN